MGNLSRHLGWLLLVPEPKERERDIVGPLVVGSGLAVGGIFAALGGTERGFPVDSIATLFLAAVILVFTVLHSLPPHHRRVRLGVRVVLTLVSVALAIWFPLTRIGTSFHGALVAVLLVLLFFGLNYFYNRSRARCARSTPSS